MKRDGLIRLVVVICVIIGVGSLCSTLATAGIIIDNFDGTAVNYRLWQPFEESQQTRLSQQGGELRIQIEGGSVDHGAGVNSKFRLKGDFDATVDYRLISWPPTNGVRLGFEGGPNDRMFMVKRISYGPSEPPNPKENYFAYFSNESQWSGNIIPTADNQGSLRLTRVGAILAGYYKQNGLWQQIASFDYSPSGYIEWVDICLWAIGDPPAGQNVEIAFSNFQVTYDQIKYISVPGSVELLLLD